MADSNITKQALAMTVKELMEEKAFEKISVSDICESCNMSRKSFYYHFRDKYDLVNWIFDTEFKSVESRDTYPNFWKLMGNLCNYFYKNKDFYLKAIQIKGQNSFSEYFNEYLYQSIATYFEPSSEEEGRIEFYVFFLTDACVAAIERWLLPKDGLLPREFLELLQSSIANIGQEVSWNI